MDAEALRVLMEESGFPFAYDEFKSEIAGEDEPEPPFGSLIQEETNHVYADGIPVFTIKGWSARLYTVGKDEKAEKKLEAIFDRNGISWVKKEESFPEEEIYECTYQFETEE